jgi:hypothetical protein
VDVINEYMLQPVKIVFKSMYISCSISRLKMSKFLRNEVSSKCIVHYKNDVQYNCSVLNSCDMSCMDCVAVLRIRIRDPGLGAF